MAKGGGSGWNASYNKSAKGRRKRYDVSRYVLSSRNFQRGKKYSQSVALPF